MHFGEVVNKSASIFSCRSIDNREILRCDVETKAGFSSIVDLAKVRAFNDCAADIHVFCLEDTALESDLNGVLLVDSRGKDNLDAHVLKSFNRGLVLVHVLLLVKNADSLHAKIVKSSNFFDRVLVLHFDVAFQELSCCVPEGLVPNGWDGHDIWETVAEHH
jgi:hypothetical protein